MMAAELIERKREGEELSRETLRDFLDAYGGGDVADYQMSAFLMAVYFRGLSGSELSELTRAIVDSGERLDFRGGETPAVDKHSTGGVGDKVSLVLCPLLAEAGLRIPMMSGRGLGHTGGTLDKLESIPGFRTDLTLEQLTDTVRETGCAMIGQTERIAPLDGRLYALRDVTGTVPSVPLIASSIISKKLAEGIEALVLDVKCGRGAFMREEEEALTLGRTLVELAEAEGLKTRALVTGMEAPLGRAVGNALEVREAVACLRGGGPRDLREVTLALGGELLAMTSADSGAGARSSSGAPSSNAFEEGAAGGQETAGAEEKRPIETAHHIASLAAHLDDGSAADRFRRMVEAQGGDPRIVEDPGRLPGAPTIEDYRPEEGGHLKAVDARALGLAAVELGAGRRRLEDDIDPAVGFELLARPGDRVADGQPLARIHAPSPAAARRAARRLKSALTLSDRPPAAGDLAWERSRVRYRITARGVERPAS